MKITSKEIREKLTEAWPDLEYVWLWDTVYWTPAQETVQEALDNSNVPTMTFVPEFHDCDDFAVQFMAEVRRKRYFQWKAGKLPEESRFPITIGFCFGDTFRGISKPHAANLCICAEGVYILDATPGEKRMWKAEAENDNLIFVFM
jgi:hypothetical protein